MTKQTIIFDDIIDFQSVPELITKLNTELPVSLFLSGDGGAYYYEKILAHTINGLNNITIYPFGSCSSAMANLVVFDLDCPVIITDKCESLMFHKCDRYSHRLRKTGELDHRELLKIDKKINRKQRRNLKQILTQKQLKTFDKGEDVILYRKDYKKVLKDYKFNLNIT